MIAYNIKHLKINNRSHKFNFIPKQFSGYIFFKYIFDIKYFTFFKSDLFKKKFNC